MGDFTISVPFERLVELPGLREGRQRWRRLGPGLTFFEMDWKPKRWTSPARFVFLRQAVAQRQRGPLSSWTCSVPHELG